jgi:ABC-type Fe3+-hydroxamate transport system substrate-binding protein
MSGYDKHSIASQRTTLFIEEAREKVEKTIVYMTGHFNENVTREKLAALVGLNPEHYSRIFKKYKGVSPIDYMTELRMEQAKQLLHQTSGSIRAIAKQVGYEDPYYFSRRFKQIVGVSPSGFVHQPSQRVVALDYYGHCMALGIEPVGASSGDISDYFPNGSTRTQNVSVYHKDRFDLQSIKKLQPDLILTARKEWEAELSLVAPTQVVDMNQDPIYDHLLMIAGWLGKEQEARSWIGEYEKRAADLRAKLAGCMDGKKVAVLRIRSELMQMYGVMNMGYPLYRGLQLEPPDKIKWQSMCNAYYHSSVISIEELSFYEADHLFVVLQHEAADELAWAQIQETEAWRSYPAVRSGNVYRVEAGRWLAFDAVSVMEQMNDAAELLLARK